MKKEKKRKKKVKKRKKKVKKRKKKVKKTKKMTKVKDMAIVRKVMWMTRMIKRIQVIL